MASCIFTGYENAKNALLSKFNNGTFLISTYLTSKNCQTLLNFVKAAKYNQIWSHFPVHKSGTLLCSEDT